MSLTSKAAFWTASALTIGTIGLRNVFDKIKEEATVNGSGVNTVDEKTKVKADKQKLHEGVIRDIERQQKRKIENLYFLQQQIEMSKILKKQESQDDAVALKLLEDSKKK